MRSNLHSDHSDLQSAGNSLAQPKGHGLKGVGTAVEALRLGKPVAIPTETVYGLAADATHGEAIAKIFATKGRPSFNPLICHVDGLVMAEEHGQLNALALQLAKEFWPGPLTMVVPLQKLSPIHELVTAGLGTVGLRCPKGLARQIISAFGKPLAAPSANRSGKISPTSADHVREEYRELVSSGELVIVDGGKCDVGLESTIVKIENDRLILLRPGAITALEISDLTGITVEYPKDDGQIQAPGMMKSHYAPDAEVKLNCVRCDGEAAWLGFGGNPMEGSPTISLNLSPDSNLVEAAANLYGYLKKLDATGAKKICVSPIPEDGLGIAINDRLRRAAAARPNNGSESVTQ
jgi:L-threonylcarbamoyladenylate synthase